MLSASPQHRSHTLAVIRRLRAAGPLPRHRRLPPQQQPELIRAEYFKALLPIVRRAGAAFAHDGDHVLSLLAADRRRAGKFDAPDDSAAAAIDRAAERFAATFRPHEVEALAEKFARRTVDHQRGQLDRQLRRALGVSPQMLERPIRDLIPVFTSSNAELVKSVADRYFERLRRDVAQAFNKGEHPDTLAERFVALDGMAENDARRLARDQIGKLNAQVNQARQESLGVEEFDWETMNDGRVRDSHAELQGQRFRWDDPPIIDGAPTLPGEDVMCVPEDAAVLLHAPALKAYRRRYSGQLAELIADAHEPLRVTPNHPVLTSRGWRPAHLVKAGDYLVEAPAQSFELPIANPERSDPSAGEIFRACAALGVAHRVGGPAVRFHGDPGDEEVEIVEIDRLLLADLVSQCAETFGDHALTRAAQAALSQRDTSAPIIGAGTARSFMSGMSQDVALFGGHVPHADEHRRATIAWLDAAAQQNLSHGKPGAPQAYSDALLAEPSLVPREHFRYRKVQRVGVRPWTGVVINFETLTGWFSSHGLIVHNCRCYGAPVLDLLL